MRVLLATTLFAPELGGVPRLLQDFCAHAAQDIELYVLSVRQQPAAFYAEYDAHAPFPIERIDPQGRGGQTSVRFMQRVWSLLRNWKPDVILSGVGYPTAILIALVTRMTGTPFVVYTHSEDVTIQRPRARQALAWALRRAAKVITVSHFTERELERLGIPKNNVTIIPPGVALERFQNTQPIPAFDAQWVILTAGRLIWRKGQDTVLRVLPQILAQKPNAQYVIVGSGPDEPGLRALAQEVSVSEHVQFVGRVDDEMLPSYFAACQIFVMPTRPSPDASETEGFGIVFLEASAAGKPIVAGRAGGVSDAVADGETGLLVDPNNAQAVCDAILQCACNPDFAQRLGQNGRVRVEREFTVELFGARLSRVLAQATKEKTT